MQRPILIASLLLAGCAAPAQLPVESTVSVAANLAVAGAAERQVLAEMVPWAKTDIDHAVVALYTDVGIAPLASQTIAQADLDMIVTFKGLRQTTPYRIVVTAFAPDGPDADTDPDPIHDTDVATCNTAFTTTLDPTLTLTSGIKLKLRDKVFSGATAGNALTVTNGQLSHSGSASITVQ